VAEVKIYDAQNSSQEGNLSGAKEISGYVENGTEEAMALTLHSWLEQ
jgi:hypothetical protein